MASPSIACIGIIGKQNNLLHISLFPPTRSMLEFSLLLSSNLDIFEARIRPPLNPVDQDFGLLQAVDERLACYGWMTNTGVKFVAVVDMEGRPAPSEVLGSGKAVITGIRDSDLKPLFKALQTAYVRLLQNPFYDPDEHSPLGPNGEPKVGSTQITSQRFIKEVRRIGDTWAPGITNI